MNILNFQPQNTDQQLQSVFDDFPVSLRLRWNQRFGYWSLSIYDRENTPILTGIKLVQDYPLIGHHNLDQFTGELVMLKVNSNKERPDIDSIGNDHMLVYLTKDEVDELVS